MTLGPISRGTEPLEEVSVRTVRELGELIIAARKRQGYTQRQVAAALGVTQAWISRVEQGRERAWVGQILRLASFLEIDLLARVPESPVSPPHPSENPFFPDQEDWID